MIVLKVWLISKKWCKKFIYASTCSVYGISDSPNVETDELKPITDYNKYKVYVNQY